MLLVRTDASSAIGVGHAMRCLALAQQWLARRRDEDVVFAMREPPAALVDRLERERIRVVEPGTTAAQLGELARRLEARAAVLDGYLLDKEEQSALADGGNRPLLVIDDEGETASAAAAVVLNQNPFATEAIYRGLDARLLLGPRYVLLRREFESRHDAAGMAAPGRAPRVLVTFGGADPRGLTRATVAALEGMDVDLDVVVGTAYRDPTRLGREASSRVHLHVAVEDMATLMRRADIAVLAAGSTCWELACVGVPMLVVATADNQRAVARAVEEQGIGYSLGEADAFDGGDLRRRLEALIADCAARQRMRTAGRELVDGRGAARVVGVLADLVTAKEEKQ